MRHLVAAGVISTTRPECAVRAKTGVRWPVKCIASWEVTEWGVGPRRATTALNYEGETTEKFSTPQGPVK